MTSVLSAAELGALQALAEDVLLPDQCELHTYTAVETPRGGRTDTWVAQAAPVACRITRMPPSTRGTSEQDTGVQVRAVVGFRGSFPLTATIGNRDRVRHLGSGATYEVQGVRGPASWEMQRQVDLVRVQ